MKFFQTIGERIQAQAGIQKVYGEPIETHGKTIIPIAKVTFGYGIGIGNLSNPSEETLNNINPEAMRGGGAGGGGGASITPVGVMEITSERTKFIPVDDWKTKSAVFMAGFTTALLLFRVLKKKSK